jgi:CubicO group peptidase (beta-lactamase class C family)
VDLLDLLLMPGRPFKAICRVPRDLDSVTDLGDEVRPGDVGSSERAVERIWEAVEALYRTGLYPAVQICLRRDGGVVLDRAIGHAEGNQPGSPRDAETRPVTVETPFCLYSASKAIAAMLVHKLDERRLLHLDDRVCDYLPEFGRHGKEWITIRHVLGHRAGIPNLPEGAMDLDLLDDPEHVLALLCEAHPVSVPGRRLAYHAVTGGFVLGELVRRVAGADIREVQRKELQEPLGFRWMNFGVAPEDVPLIARDAVTGLPVLPPFSWVFRRALGVDFADAVKLASDPRFLTGIVPAANAVATARELSAFYQCLLDGGELGGVRVFDPRTVRHATSEQTYWELDLTLGLPLRYGLGFMLGGEVSLFGLSTPHAFGHLGFTNIFSWADPERRLAAAILTSGKPFLSLESVRLVALLIEISRAFPKLASD